MKLYFAEIEFADGTNAHAEDTSLSRLRKRIRDRFAREKTEWGNTSNSAVVNYRIFKRLGFRLLEVE